MICYGGWLRTTRRETSVLGGLPLAALSPHAITRLTERSRDPFTVRASIALLITLGKLATVLSDGDYTQASDRSFLMRIDDTVFAGAMRLVGGSEGAMANWCIDIRTVLSPDMLTPAELRQAAATGEALKTIVRSQIERAYTLDKALPIVPAREDFIVSNAKQIAMGRTPAATGTNAIGGRTDEHHTL